MIRLVTAAVTLDWFACAFLSVCSFCHTSQIAVLVTCEAVQHPGRALRMQIQFERDDVFQMCQGPAKCPYRCTHRHSGLLPNAGASPQLSDGPPCEKSSPPGSSNALLRLSFHFLSLARNVHIRGAGGLCQELSMNSPFPWAHEMLRCSQPAPRAVPARRVPPGYLYTSNLILYLVCSTNKTANAGSTRDGRLFSAASNPSFGSIPCPLTKMRFGQSDTESQHLVLSQVLVPNPCCPGTSHRRTCAALGFGTVAQL